jgi:hypothetical protein
MTSPCCKYTHNYVACLQGPRGPEGPAGPAGTASNTGAVGPTGPYGYTGVEGPQGASSNTGATGPIGSLTGTIDNLSVTNLLSANSLTLYGNTVYSSYIGSNVFICTSNNSIGNVGAVTFGTANTFIASNTSMASYGSNGDPSANPYLYVIGTTPLLNGLAPTTHFNEIKCYYISTIATGSRINYCITHRP